MELKEFTEKDCIRTMYAIPSDGSTSNAGKVCVIPLSDLTPSFRKPEYQLFRIQSGFGCSPKSIGRACYGYFCADGEKAMWSKDGFIGVGNDTVEAIAAKLESEREKSQGNSMEM